MKKLISKKVIALIACVVACMCLASCGKESSLKDKTDTHEITEKHRGQSKGIAGKGSDTVQERKLSDKDSVAPNKALNSEPTSDESPSDEYDIDTSAETVDISNVNKEALHEALNNYRFTLCGTSFDMSETVKISDLTDLGYEFSTVNDSEIEPDKYSLSSSKMVHENGSVIKVTPCNTTESTVAYLDAELYSIEIEYYNEDKYSGYNPDFRVDGADILQLNALTLEQFDELTSDMDNVEAYDSTGYNTRTVYTSSEKYFSRNKYTFTFKDNILTIIKITYM